MNELNPAVRTGIFSDSDSLGRAKLSTRLAFFIAGFGLACWAPLVPFAKARLGVGEAELGSILLFLGVGSVIGMPLAGALVGRLSARIVTLGGAIGIAVALPVLAIATNATQLSMALFVFGMSIGAVDVSANVHGTAVQARAKQPLMSGFHGLYSVGGLLGAGGMTLALSAGAEVTAAAMTASLIVTVALLAALRGFVTLPASTSRKAGFAMPHRIVVLIGVMALLTFLVEGAVLDWGAILLSEFKGVELGNAGTGYSAFALTMTLTRLVGDCVVARAGDRATLAWGSILTAAGVALSAWGETGFISVVGFCITGIGAANIIPVLFTLAATQRVMPSGLAISTVSTLGYLGVFLGPALIGYAASAVTLPMCFVALAALMLIVAALTRTVAPASEGRGK